MPIETHTRFNSLKLSKENKASRLYQQDVEHLRRKIKTYGVTDTRFKDISAAIRHYVHLGVITEKRTETANTLTDRIYRETHNKILEDKLLPLKNSIDKLINRVQEIDQSQKDFFIDADKKDELLMRQILTVKELLSDQLSSIIKEILSFGKLGKESLRNIIVIRSILYVFLLATKTGRIDTGEENNWNELVTFAHEKAHELAIEELNILVEGELESAAVQNLARQMFTAIKTQKTGKE